jgi:hypothetical protein
VALQPVDRVAEREFLVVVLRPVARRVVAGRVRGGAVRHVLDQRRTAAGARTLGGPLRDRVHREEVVAVHAHAGDSITRPARREGLALAARVALEGRDRPLVVDDAEDDRRLVHRGEQERVVEVGLGARALADPAHRDRVLALDRRRHGPAHGLRELRREVAGDREDVAVAPVVHDGQLPALAHVARVREQLAHEVEHRPPAREIEPLVAVRGEQHVRGAQRHRHRDRHRLLAVRAHVEGDLSGTLDALHAVVEYARQQHVAQRDLQLGRLQVRMPRPDGAVLVVEHAHEAFREVADLAGGCADVRARDLARGRELQIAEIGRIAGTRRRLRHVQA